jgi:hypothetical protein
MHHQIGVVMKLVFTLMIAAAALAAEDSTVPKSTPEVSHSAVKPAGLPTDAVEIQPGIFRVTDAAGVKWLYRQTPFGLARSEERPDATAPDLFKILPGLKITDTGDTLVFERPSPFGLVRSVRKKSELNEQEKAAWERAKNGAKQN